MPAGIALSTSVLVGKDKPVDAKYGPYASVAAALLDLPVSMRYQGLTVGIITTTGVKEYWFWSGTGDVDLIEKVTAGSIPTDQIIEDTYSNLMNLCNSGSLITGKYYKITDFRLTWWDYTSNSYVGPGIAITSGLTNGSRYLLKSKGTTTDAQLANIGCGSGIGAYFTYNGGTCVGTATVIPIVLGQEIMADQLEPLILLAATNRQFATVAYSTIHPEDIIHYEFNTSQGWGSRLGKGFDALPNSRGWITRRIGYQYGGIVGEYKAGIIDAPYDWRHMTFSCRRMDLSNIPEWTTSGTYQTGQVVKWREKLFTPCKDNVPGRYEYSTGFLVDNPPDNLRAEWRSNVLYDLGAEISYVAKPGEDSNASALAGQVKHYRKTGAGAMGVRPTDSSTWTEASLLADFDWFTRKDYNGSQGSEEINTLNFWNWVPLSPFVEGKTYFPTSELYHEEDQYRFFNLYKKIETRLAWDETPYYNPNGASNVSGGVVTTTKYTQFYGLPRMAWNWNIINHREGTVYILWDFTSRAQKPTFAENPTSNATPVTWSRDPDFSHRAGVGRAANYVRHSHSIKLGALGNVFYGWCSYIDIGGQQSAFNVFKGGFSGLTAQDGFQKNLISAGDSLRCGFSFANNKCGYGFGSNSFGDHAQLNNFGPDYRQNAVGNRFQSNTFGWNTSNNVFGSEVIYNLFAGLTDLNIFGNVIAGNKFGLYTSANTVGTTFCNNEMSGFARSSVKSGNNNLCTYVFWDNGVSGIINNCKFGNFQKNLLFNSDNSEFTGEAYYNKCFDDLSYVTVGNGFVGNFVSRIYGATFGPNLKYVTIESDSILTPETLSAAQLYGNYHKRLLWTSGGTRRLIYFDGNGAQQSVAV